MNTQLIALNHGPNVCKARVKLDFGNLFEITCYIMHIYGRLVPSVIHEYVVHYTVTYVNTLDLGKCMKAYNIRMQIDIHCTYAHTRKAIVHPNVRTCSAHM